jgi:phenylacetate-CoA ligase
MSGLALFSANRDRWLIGIFKLGQMGRFSSAAAAPASPRNLAIPQTTRPLYTGLEGMGTAKRVLDTANIAWRTLRERRIPYLPLETLIRLQSDRVRAIVRHAYETVPFYREAMDERRLRPQDFRTASDLAQLPIVDGSAVQERPEQFASSARKGVQSLHSTGTAGLGRRCVLWNDDALLGQVATGGRDRAVLYGLLGKHWGLRRLSLFPAESTTRATLRYQHGRIHVPRFVRQTRYVPLGASYDDVVEEINRFRPEVVYSYGSIAEHLCRYVADRGMVFRAPRVWVYGADRLSEEGRSLIRERWGCGILSTYQSVEGGRMGFLCERDEGFHLNVDVCAIRIVDRDGRDVPAGESGEVVISNLVNRATVLLNYRQSDRGALAAPAPCRCGRTLPLLERLEGRTSEVLRLADGREVLDNALAHACKEVLKGIIQYQIVEERRGSFRWRIVPATGVDREPLVAALRARAFDVLGPRDDLTIEIVDRIEVPEGGKLLRVVRQAPPPSPNS